MKFTTRPTLLLLLLQTLATHQLHSQPANEDDRYWSSVPGSDRFGNASVNAIAVTGDTVYLGGDFSHAGDLAAAGVVMWVRSDDSWHRLADASGRDGLNGIVRSLSIIDGNLYVGGSFDSAGQVAARNIAVWDGSRWGPVGDGLPVPVSSILRYGGDIVATGDNGTRSRTDDRIAFAYRLEGTTWSPLFGGGIPVAGIIEDLAVDEQGRLVANAIGTFPDSGAKQFPSFVWNEPAGRWQPLKAPQPVYRLHAIGRLADGHLVAMGTSNRSNGGSSIYILDDSVWTEVPGSTLNNDILDAFERYSDLLAAPDGTIYAAGKYLHLPGDEPGNDVLRWDGSAWSGLGRGLAYEGNVLAWSGDDLLAGGRFSTAGGVPAFSIARWSDGEWYAVGDGIAGGSVTMRSVHFGNDGALWVSGTFNRVGEIPANGIARWDGVEWEGLGEGIDTAATSLLLTTSGELMINAGYSFTYLTRAGGESIQQVAEWSRGAWRSPGIVESGLVRWFRAGAGFAEGADGTLWYGADFMSNGSTDGEWIDPSLFSRRDGVWSVDSSVKGAFMELVPCGEEICAAGVFEHPGGSVNLESMLWTGHWAGNFGRFDGSAWSGGPLGSVGEIAPFAFAIAAEESDFYVGGRFSLRTFPQSSSVGRFDWQSLEWTPLGTGLRRAGDTGQGTVWDLALVNGQLFACGEFDTAGISPAENIAVWNGSEWSTPGSGLDGVAQQMTIGPVGEVYVVGNFTHAGGNSVPGLAVWKNPALSVRGSDLHPVDSREVRYTHLGRRLRVDFPEPVVRGRDVIVSDLLGRRVAELRIPPGSRTVTFDPDAESNPVPAGVYIVSVTGVADSEVFPLQ